MGVPRRQLLRLFTLGFGSAMASNRIGFASGTAMTEGVAKEKVTGIGGLFFRARDPAALALWYQEKLGVSLIPSHPGEQPWQQEAGPTAFAPFAETTKYFGDASKAWMVNFRVRDLDKMKAQLTAAGVTVAMDPQTYPNGRFARIHDPEGNPIELWQPAS